MTAAAVQWSALIEQWSAQTNGARKDRRGWQVSESLESFRRSENKSLFRAETKAQRYELICRNLLKEHSSERWWRKKKRSLVKTVVVDMNIPVQLVCLGPLTVSSHRVSSITLLLLSQLHGRRSSLFHVLDNVLTLCSIRAISSSWYTEIGLIYLVEELASNALQLPYFDRLSLRLWFALNLQSEKDLMFYLIVLDLQLGWSRRYILSRIKNVVVQAWEHPENKNSKMVEQWLRL